MAQVAPLPLQLQRDVRRTQKTDVEVVRVRVQEFLVQSNLQAARQVCETLAHKAKNRYHNTDLLPCTHTFLSHRMRSHSSTQEVFVACAIPVLRRIGALADMYMPLHLHLTLCLDLCRRKLAREARRAERTGSGRLHQCELDSRMFSALTRRPHPLPRHRSTR